MTREENLKTDFYRGDSVHTVLQRYELNDDEKKVIHAAILTAKHDQPNMKLIQEADVLLNTITTTREKINNESVDIKKTSSAIGRSSVPSGKRSFSMWWWLILPILVSTLIVKIYNYGEKNINKYNFDEAQEYCREHGKILPLSIADIEAAGYTMDIHTQVWSEDGDIITWIYGKTKSDGKKHHVVCVDKNGN